MMLAPPPRHFLSAPPPPPSMLPSAALPGAGLPQERLARIAARRAFVDIKRRFIDAVAEVAGQRGQWLRYQIRQAHEPVDLWLLRGAVFSALHGGDDRSGHLRLDLHRALDCVFPDGGEMAPMLAL
jgi:hypothetical protein